MHFVIPDYLLCGLDLDDATRSLVMIMGHNMTMQ